MSWLRVLPPDGVQAVAASAALLATTHGPGQDPDQRVELRLRDAATLQARHALRTPHRALAIAGGNVSPTCRWSPSDWP